MTLGEITVNPSQLTEQLLNYIILVTRYRMESLVNEGGIESNGPKFFIFGQTKKGKKNNITYERQFI